MDFQDSHYGGDQLTWNGDFGCSGGMGFGVDAMPANWDEKVSSAFADGGCNSFTHYQCVFHGGTQYVCTCETMGAMNDRTSSEEWSQ